MGPRGARRETAARPEAAARGRPADTGRAHEGELARTHEGEPGLPRGRSRLPTETVRTRQRERLLRAVIAAVSSAGYQDVTVADIVRRARVSRAAFYAHFSDKQDCFLAATRDGGQLMTDYVLDAARKIPPGTSPERVLRISLTAFLEFLVSEPAFARAFYLGMPAAGPRALNRFYAAARGFVEMNQAWHERARATTNPEWPAVPQQAYLALSGATTELVRAEVVQDRIASITGLADTLVSLHLSVLAGRPWSSAR